MRDNEQSVCEICLKDSRDTQRLVLAGVVCAHAFFLCQQRKLFSPSHSSPHSGRELFSFYEKALFSFRTKLTSEERLRIRSTSLFRTTDFHFLFLIQCLLNETMLHCDDGTTFISVAETQKIMINFMKKKKTSKCKVTSSIFYLRVLFRFVYFYLLLSKITEFPIHSNGMEGKWHFIRKH